MSDQVVWFQFLSPAGDRTVIPGADRGQPFDVIFQISFRWGVQFDRAYLTYDNFPQDLQEIPVEDRDTLDPNFDYREYKATITARKPGEKTIRVYGFYWDERGQRLSDDEHLFVEIQDHAAPVLTILNPQESDHILSFTEGSSVFGFHSYYFASLTVQAIEYLGMQPVEYQLDQGEFAQADLVIEYDNSDYRYGADVEIRESPPGPHSLTVRGTDLAGNAAAQISVNFNTVDVVAPTPWFTAPDRDNSLVQVHDLTPDPGCTMALEGLVYDGHSGMLGGAASIVVLWNGQPLENIPISYDATDDPLWAQFAHWSTAVTIREYGNYHVTVRVKDAAGNQADDLTYEIQVISDYQPKGLEELLDGTAYLYSLNTFASNHVQVDAQQHPLDSTQLERVFYQPFGHISQPLSGPAAQPVSQLRIALETLRLYQKGHPQMPMLARWKMDEGSGNAVKDAAGDGQVGSFTGLEWVAGQGLNGSPALHLTEAQGQGIRIAADDLRRLSRMGQDSADFSVSLWVNVEDTHSQQQNEMLLRVLAHKSNISAAPPTYLFYLGLSTQDNTVLYGISDSGPATDQDGQGIGRSQIPTNTWTHLCLVYGSGQQRKTLKLYINGIEDSEADVPYPLAANQDPFYIGPAEGMPSMNGFIQDVRVYDLALPAEAVQALAAQAGADPRAPTEREYCQAVYENLLNQMGSSYAEIRLARGADDDVRGALALRLGIPTNALDSLNLEPGKFGEAELSWLFGLDDTSAPPLPVVSAAPAPLPVPRTGNNLLLDSIAQALSKPVPDDAAVSLPGSLFRTLGVPVLVAPSLAFQDGTAPGAPGTPLVLQWRLNSLAQSWIDQDTADAQSALIIDPDLIGLDDIEPGASAAQIWQARREQVDAVLAALKNLQPAAAPYTPGFNDMLDFAMNGFHDLEAIDAESKAGRDISADLQAHCLSPQAFQRLLRLQRLAAKGPLTDSEWEDVRSILAQVCKNQFFLQWRTQEIQMEITLTPGVFKISDSPAGLPAWLASAADRQAWQAALQSRFDQRQTVQDRYQAMLAAAEAFGLPLLRDALLAGWFGADIAGGMAEWLTGRLMIDLRVGGDLRTTRVLQAVQSLQGILFALRSQTFPYDHPASQWKLVDPLNQADPLGIFDLDWQWIGAYETWRAARMVFLYPENILLPNVREREDAPYLTVLYPFRTREFVMLMQGPGAVASSSTPPQGDAWTGLLNMPQLSPADASRAYQYYLQKASARYTFTGDVKTLLDSLASAPALYGPDLDRLAKFSCNFTYDATDFAATTYSEIFFFVPLQIALQLMKAKQYLAALDWFKVFYAYQDPPGQQIISYVLCQEKDQGDTVDLAEDPDWLDFLNPHRLVGKHRRPYPYTRFVLMNLARCFIEYGDAEFTRDTVESLARARGLYLTARALLGQRELNLFRPTESGRFLFANPVLEVLRMRVENQLTKLRQGRNIAGMKRQDETLSLSGAAAPLSFTNSGQISLPSSPLRPTPYRFRVLIERAKTLVNLAQQIETAYLNALEKVDEANYNLLKARNDLEMANEGVKLQNLRVCEADDGQTLANLQTDRAAIQFDHYDQLLNAGLTQNEKDSLNEMLIAFRWTIAAGAAGSLGAVAGIVSGAIGGAVAGAAYSNAPGGGLGAVIGGVAGALSAGLGGLSASFQTVASSASLHAQFRSQMASYERRAQDWQLQKSLAQQDIAIGQQQITIAGDNYCIANEELTIANKQVDHDQALLNFLANKFTGPELYEWMSGVLAGVYAYFLQQATATARLAEAQLTFERQQVSPALIQSDYWSINSSESIPGASSGSTPDRRGLTGSARLLQDIYQLDQFAFESDKRKLNLTQTFSLSSLMPAEFNTFRRTGVLSFSTPLSLFDRAFPGHYLRLIRAVRTSVVALVPPNQGIRAALTASGLSRVVTGGDTFQTIVIHRDPESVALTSTMNATGVFEMDVQSDMLLPFESMGVDTQWLFELPRAANPFDYDSIADVLITIDYTALSSFDYRQQVLQSLKPDVSLDRAYSLRENFADAWYELNNPAQSATPMVVTFDTQRADFPPNLLDGSVTIQHVVLYIARREGLHFSVTVQSLRLTPPGSDPDIVGGQVVIDDGIASSRSGSATGWLCFQGCPPFGRWTLDLSKPGSSGGSGGSSSADGGGPGEIPLPQRFASGDIQDILFVITYAGRLPDWPA